MIFNVLVKKCTATKACHKRVTYRFTRNLSTCFSTEFVGKVDKVLGLFFLVRKRQYLTVIDLLAGVDGRYGQIRIGQLINIGHQ